MIRFYTTDNPALAADLVYRNYRLAVLHPSPEATIFEFYESEDLLKEVENFNKGRDGFKRLLGIYASLVDIARRAC